MDSSSGPASGLDSNGTDGGFGADGGEGRYDRHLNRRRGTAPYEFNRWLFDSVTRGVPGGIAPRAPGRQELPSKCMED